MSEALNIFHGGPKELSVGSACWISAPSPRGAAYSKLLLDPRGRALIRSLPVSFGSTLEATGGLAAPVISGRDVNYPDLIVSLFAAGAILAGLAERDRTGRGAHLDLSQRELTSFLLGKELLAALDLEVDAAYRDGAWEADLEIDQFQHRDRRYRRYRR
jgi:hypothetical protein